MNDNINVLIGRRLYNRRRMLGLSLKELAAELGVSYQQVHKYENGSNRVSAELLHRLCALLKTDYAYFFAPNDSSQKSTPINVPAIEDESLYLKLSQIENPAVRKKVIHVLSALVDSES